MRSSVSKASAVRKNRMPLSITFLLAFILLSESFLAFSANAAVDAAVDASAPAKADVQGNAVANTNAVSNTSAVPNTNAVPDTSANFAPDSIATLPANSDAPRAVEELTRQILLKEIALERFNLNYKQNAAKQGRWKGLRYSLWGISNSALGLAGGITSVYNRGIHVNRASQVKGGLQENANTLSMIGSIIGAGAAGQEMLINGWHEFQAYKKGFSPGIARKHVFGILADMERLQSQRDALVKMEQSNPSLAPQARVHEIEGRVIDDLKDQSLLEFKRFHLGARKLLSFQQMQYFFDIASNSTAAIGYNFAFLSLYRKRRVWNYRAGVMLTISGALVMGGPLVSRVFSRVVSRYHGSTLKESIAAAENKDLSKLEKDMRELESFCRQDKDYCPTIYSALERCKGYGERSRIFQNQLQQASEQLAKSRLIATENVAAGLYTGGSRVAGGILFIIPGYLQLYNRSGERPTKVTNDLLLASGIIGLPASAFKLADTVRIQGRGEYDRWKLAKEGRLPGQLISTRLSQLDEMESRLKGK